MGGGASNLSLFLPGNRIYGSAESTRSSESNFHKHQYSAAINHYQVDLPDATLVVALDKF
jgi:hypothetical protein